MSTAVAKTPSRVNLLKAGTLEETDESEDKKKQPSRRQLLKLEQRIDNLPTHIIMGRLYKRHALSIWQLLAIGTWAVIIYTKVR